MMSRELPQVQLLSTCVVNLAEDIIKNFLPKSFIGPANFEKGGQQANHIIRMTVAYCLNVLWCN